MQPYADVPMRKVIWKDIELINEVAEKRNYNRQIDLSKLKKEVKKQIKSMGYENFNKVFFAAKEIMLHEHKGGKKCAPHMRIGIWFPNNIQVYVDCDLQLWNSFERVLYPFKEKPKLTLVK